jgi:hypothetical protein
MLIGSERKTFLPGGFASARWWPACLRNSEYMPEYPAIEHKRCLKNKYIYKAWKLTSFYQRYAETPAGSRNKIPSGFPAHFPEDGWVLLYPCGN